MSFTQRNLCRGCLQNQPNQLAHMSLGGCLYTQEDEEDEEDKEDEDDWETDSNASADSIEEYVFIGTRWVVPALSSEAEAEAEAEVVEQEAEAEAEAEKPKVDVSKSLVAPLFALPCGFEFPECAICYEQIDMVNVTVTTCGHTFHSSCAFKALENNDCCPMCRHQLLEEAESEGEYEESVDEEEDGSDNGEDEDDESEADDFKVNLEQLAGKVTNMGYTMHDILKFFVSDIKSGTNEQRYSEEFFDKMEQEINGVIQGTISLAHRDARSYAAVASVVSVASMASVAAAPKAQAPAQAPEQAPAQAPAAAQA